MEVCRRSYHDTISEVIPNRSDQNYMKLNPKKCRELRVNFQHDLSDLPQLTIDRIPLETISSHKLLGVQIQDDLKWNEHVDIITKKAARRLYIIRILKRNGVPEDDLISTTSLIRSRLDYTAALCGIHASLLSLLRRLNVYRSDFSVLYSHFYLTVFKALNSSYWMPKT